MSACRHLYPAGLDLMGLADKSPVDLVGSSVLPLAQKRISPDRKDYIVSDFVYRSAIDVKLSAVQDVTGELRVINPTGCVSSHITGTGNTLKITSSRKATANVTNEPIPLVFFSWWLRTMHCTIIMKGA